MDIWIGKPNKVADVEIRAAAVLIQSGGALEVKIEVLEDRLRRCRTLAIYRNEDRLIAVACIKNPDPKYRIGVFEKAGVSMDSFQSAPELGYVTVDQSVQGKGLATKLVSALLTGLREPCYATTDNNSMKKILRGIGFTEQGNAWVGQRGSLTLWAML